MGREVPVAERVLELQAPAKINLCLHVGPRRGDGFHSVCSLMEKVSLFDSIRVGPSREGMRVRGMDIPREDNIVSRAVEALERETGKVFSIDIEIGKEIPMAAGLAGGSSDAAAVMRAVDCLAGLGLTSERLSTVAAEVGADVPFFVTEGPQLAAGAGELLEAADGLAGYHIALAVPDAELSTARVYRLFDEAGGVSGPDFRRRCMELKASLGEAGGLDGMVSLLYNDLESVASALVPEIGRIKDTLLELGAAGALMSGSGPSVFGLFAAASEASAAAAALRRTGLRAWAAAPLRPPAPSA